MLTYTENSNTRTADVRERVRDIAQKHKKQNKT